ncbi:hypothetical protein BT69DRAFT_410461 [Atractiella rhizophila]|nr:hypothetical protein BT69DRAFT_410461 [Atractiella rhizophila]
MSSRCEECRKLDVECIPAHSGSRVPCERCKLLQLSCTFKFNAQLLSRKRKRVHADDAQKQTSKISRLDPHKEQSVALSSYLQRVNIASSCTSQSCLDRST